MFKVLQKVEMFKVSETTFKRLCVIFLISLLSSCVGTIEDTSKIQSAGEEVPTTPFSFDGVELAVPISHHKVELYFYPSSLSVENSTYIVTYDGLQVPITSPALSLETDYRGYLRLVVEDLEIDTNYVFKVQVRDDLTLIESSSDNVVEVRTFANTTSDFVGISVVRNRPGLDGINSIEVEWPEATRTGSIFVPDEGDTVEYRVTLIDKSAITPADFHNEAFAPPVRKVFIASGDRRSMILNGLQSDTEYYVNIRAVHEGYTQFGSDLNYKKDSNNKYLEIKTLSFGIAGIEFDAGSYSLTLSPGSTGLSSAKGQWAEAVGAFDHYRLYYALNGTGVISHDPDANCNGPESTNANIICKKVPFSESESLMTDLSPHTTYESMLAVCQSVSCDVLSRKTSDVKTIKTTPQTASFGGIQSIDHAKSALSINSITLNIEAPDFDSGIIDGILIEYFDYGAGQVYELNNPLVANTHPDYEVTPFDYTDDTEIEITGINPYANLNVCFAASAYVIDNGNVVVDENNKVTECLTPTVMPPNLSEFVGLSNCAPSIGGLTLQWAKPSSGVYTHIEVFMKEGNTGFDFTNALSGIDPDYTSVIVPSVKTTHIFEDLDNTKDYQFGAVSYFYGNGQAFKSEPISGGILTCSPL